MYVRQIPGPNTPLLLKAGDMSLIQSGNSYTGKGSIEFWWEPEPGYYFRFLTGSENEIKQGDSARLTFERNEVPVFIRWTWIDENNNFVCEGPLKTQIIYGSMHQRIDELRCFIANFRIYPLKSILLVYKNWQISLSPLEDITNILKNLDRNGGYAFTYQCKIRHHNGTNFDLESVEHILDPLRLFLSFLRGAWCDLFFFEGAMNQKPIVSIHPNRLMRENHPIIPLTRWPRQPESLMCCTAHPQKDLNKAFNHFMEIYEQASQVAQQDQVTKYDQLRSIITNYIESGLTQFVETAIVLIQSALEAVASMLAHDRLTGVFIDCFNKSSAEEKIRWMLSQLSIPTDIPPEAQALQEYLAGKGLDKRDGPKAITYFRNGIVHPTPKLLTRPFGSQADRVPSEIAMEYTIALGRMYVELAILGTLNYKGNYYNRLNGQIQQLPLKPMALPQKPPSSNLLEIFSIYY